MVSSRSIINDSHLGLEYSVMQVKHGGSIVFPKGMTLNVHFLLSGPKKSILICLFFTGICLYPWQLSAVIIHMTGNPAVTTLIPLSHRVIGYSKDLLMMFSLR